MAFELLGSAVRQMSCPRCGESLDVTGIEVSSVVECPSCGGEAPVVWTVGAYTLKKRLGAGGMGVIYEAEDRTLKRTVAVKILSDELASNESFIESFAREAEITASINHPNVVQVYHFGQDGDLYYLAMELIRGGSLDDRMNARGALGEIEVLEAGIQAARGLGAAASRGLLHRDVKPGNMLYTPNHVMKIVDFGLSVPIEEARKGGGEIWGTPYYVAPEKLEQKGEDVRSDIYSLGATLFHALAGRPPFEASTASLVALKHLKSEKVALRTFAPQVNDVTAYSIERCLERYPEKRFQSYEELIENLESARKAAVERPKTHVNVQLDLTGSRLESSVTLYLILGGIFAIVLLGLLFAFKDKLFSSSDPFAVMADEVVVVETV